MSMFWLVLPLERRFENTGSASTYLGMVAPSSATWGVSIEGERRTSIWSGWFPHAMGASAISIAPPAKELRTDTNRDIVILLHETTKLVRS
jgi:hypothetical protein